jgi:hypothetical protein
MPGHAEIIAHTVLGLNVLAMMITTTYKRAALADHFEQRAIPPTTIHQTHTRTQAQV